MFHSAKRSKNNWENRWIVGNLVAIIFPPRPNIQTFFMHESTFSLQLSSWFLKDMYESRTKNTGYFWYVSVLHLDDSFNINKSLQFRHPWGWKLLNFTCLPSLVSILVLVYWKVFQIFHSCPIFIFYYFPAVSSHPLFNLRTKKVSTKYLWPLEGFINSATPLILTNMFRPVHPFGFCQCKILITQMSGLESTLRTKPTLTSRVPLAIFTVIVLINLSSFPLDGCLAF